MKKKRKIRTERKQRIKNSKACQRRYSKVDSIAFVRTLLKRPIYGVYTNTCGACVSCICIDYRPPVYSQFIWATINQPLWVSHSPFTLRSLIVSLLLSARIQWFACDRFCACSSIFMAIVSSSGSENLFSDSRADPGMAYTTMHTHTYSVYKYT